MKFEQGIIAETERLYLREIVETDAEEAFELNSDPEVLRYTGDEPFESIEQAAEFLRNYSHYKTYGFGRWAVIRKEDEAWLGWCGLKFNPETNEHDLGFRFKKKYWSKGYASEAAKECAKLAFDKFGFSELVGNVMQSNVASKKVLEKMGMVFIQKDLSSVCELKYKITKEAYESRKNTMT